MKKVLLAMFLASSVLACFIKSDATEDPVFVRQPRPKRAQPTAVRLTALATSSPTGLVLRLLPTKPTNAADIAITLSPASAPGTSLIYGAVAGRRFGFEFQTSTGKVYTVQSTVTANTNWVSTPSYFVGDGNTARFYDQLSGSHKFYRVASP